MNKGIGEWREQRLNSPALKKYNEYLMHKINVSIKECQKRQQVNQLINISAQPLPLPKWPVSWAAPGWSEGKRSWRPRPRTSSRAPAAWPAPPPAPVRPGGAGPAGWRSPAQGCRCPVSAGQPRSSGSPPYHAAYYTQLAGHSGLLAYIPVSILVSLFTTKRKQESKKKERKHDFDKASDQENDREKRKDFRRRKNYSILLEYI